MSTRLTWSGENGTPTVGFNDSSITTPYNPINAAFLNALMALLNGSSFDADTVSGAGIGGPCKDLGSGYDLNTTSLAGGLYRGSNATNGPTLLGTLNYTLIVLTDSGPTRVTQLLFSHSSSQLSMFHRTFTGTWGAWQCDSDGLNGSQPPAPKLSTSPAGGSDAPGQYYTRTQVGVGNIYANGSAGSKTGTWRIHYDVYVTATGVFVGAVNDLAPGSAVETGGSAANTYVIEAWRES
jgi:hypothetical protein